MAGRPLGNENGVTHFPARTAVFCFHLFPEFELAKPELRKLLLDFAQKTIFRTFPRSLSPPRNIHNRSRLRLTRSTRPRFDATSFEDLAMRPLVDTESAVILTQVS